MWKQKQKKRKRSISQTSSDDEAEVQVRSEVVQKLSLILKDKYHKGVLTQSFGGGQGANVIFNITGQLSNADVEAVLQDREVDPTRSFLFCNAFALVFEVGVGRAKKRSKVQPNGNAIYSAALREFVDKRVFTPPPKGTIPPTTYDSLNSLLEIVSFSLYAKGIRMSKASYGHKKPYYSIILNFAPGQILEASTLGRIKQFAAGEIKNLSLAFDEASKALKIIIRVKF